MPLPSFWRREWPWAIALGGGFLGVFYLPVEPLVGALHLPGPVAEALRLTQWYAHEHVLLCLVPALFIAGAISVFVQHDSVLRYLGPRAPKPVAYGVASISGGILAVCSCTVLPLFAGIYTRGAGLGPATTFLYAGPAINVLAVVLTARVLGLELGTARALGAVLFSVLVGLAMHALFRRDEQVRVEAMPLVSSVDAPRPLWQTGVFFATLLAILVFANWAAPDAGGGVMGTIASVKWVLTAVAAVGLGAVLVAWFGLPLRRLLIPGLAVAGAGAGFPGVPAVPFATGAVGLSAATSTREGEMEEWFGATWTFAKQILPLLLAGVLVAGLLLGRPGHEGLIPSGWIEAAVGGNGPVATFVAAFAGALMYFATLTEVPIVEGLLGAGMGQGPALALLLAGPALSLPSILVVRSVLGWRKTGAFVALVMVGATLTGLLYGAFA
jgi:uncharacterized membrane protein YraQ (UPF0718 family)